MNRTKGKGKRKEKQISRKMRTTPNGTRRKTLLGQAQRTMSLGAPFPNSWNSYSSSTLCFITDEFTNRQPCSNLLIYFSSVLGFSADVKTFRPAKQFTPYLSGLIYVQRLLFLEYALPFRAYKHLGIARRPRRGHLTRLDEIRLRYMTAGSLHPSRRIPESPRLWAAYFPDRPTFFSLPVE
jgi:hypothetical protein